MANPNFSYTRENLGEEGDDQLAGSVDIADTVEAPIEDSDGLGDVLEAGETIGQTAGEIENVETAVAEAPAEDVSAATVEAWANSLNSIHNRLGLQLTHYGSESFSRENYATTSDRESMRARFTRESIGETLKGWWSRLIAFLKRCLDAVTTWISGLLNSAKGLKKQAEEIKKLCEERKDEKVDASKTVKLSNSVGRALLGRGKKTLEVDAVIKGLGDDITLSNKISGEVSSTMAAVKAAADGLGTDGNGLNTKLTAAEGLFGKEVIHEYALGFARIIIKSKKENLTMTVTYDKSTSNAKDLSAMCVWPVNGIKICDDIITLAGKWIDDKTVKELKEKLSESIKAVQKEAKDSNASTKTELSRLIRCIQQLTTGAISAFHKDRNQMNRTGRAMLSYVKASMLEIKSKSKD